MNACVCTVRVCGVYQPVLVYDGVSLLQKKECPFFCLFCLILSQQVLLALEVVLGLAFSISDVCLGTRCSVWKKKKSKQIVTDEPT